MSCFAIYFRNMMRPKIKSVKVIVYENGKEIDISTYPEIYQMALCKSINDIWVVGDKSNFWFETEVVQICRCFKRTPPALYVTCYKEDLNARNFKAESDIPIRYRSKMFDKIHTVRPEKVGMKSWSQNVQVKFIIPQ